MGNLLVVRGWGGRWRVRADLGQGFTITVS